MGVGKFFQPPPVSMSAQRLALHKDFPDGTTSGNQNYVQWQGQIRPSELSRLYTVEMVYVRSKAPLVWVRKPNLKELSEGKPLPHVYDQEAQRLCLFMPGCGFWNSQKLISKTVMIWSELWLRYFELWIVTGEFFGKGEHPSDTDRLQED